MKIMLKQLTKSFDCGIFNLMTSEYNCKKTDLLTENEIMADMSKCTSRYKKADVHDPRPPFKLLAKESFEFGRFNPMKLSSYTPSSSACNF